MPKKVNIRVYQDKSESVENLSNKYVIDVYKDDERYWTKRVFGDNTMRGTLRFMVCLFEACGITPKVNYHASIKHAQSM